MTKTKLKPQTPVRSTRLVGQPTVLKDIDTGWQKLPGGRMRLQIKQIEWSVTEKRSKLPNAKLTGREQPPAVSLSKPN